MSVMVFDIETIPDVDNGRRLLGLAPDTSAQAVVSALRERRLAQTQQTSDFLPHYLQQIVAISVLLSTKEGVKVWSLGECDSPEKVLVERFFSGVERYTPTLVSWNGGGFDCPVLHYRALIHGVEASRYWETGRQDPQFKWNNYLGRYHERHTDLMDVLANYQPRANAPLSEIALMLGFPGKLGEHGDQVWDKYQEGQIQAIRDYCETDVVNTYGVYLAFQKMRGILDEDAVQFEKKRLRAHLVSRQQAYWAPFLEALA
jgi:predicted PolB exonuclease-like 3'-5' exonuclease